MGRRVVLLIDTCEELAKATPDGTVPRNVEETFRILRALHDGADTLAGASAGGGVPSMRVIFAGRRPLACAGFGGWQATSPAGEILPPRDFLRLHEIRGFTRAEAETFLKTKVTVPPDLVGPVIAKSIPEIGGAPIAWPDGHEKASALERCNPYELKLYADWARDKPAPTRQQLEEASSAQFIEWRVLRRLNSPLMETLLPTVALLGQFDRPMLQKICILPDGDFFTLFEKLRHQEWIDAKTAPVGDGKEQRLVLSVDPGIRERLLAYYRERGAEAATFQARAADSLERITLHDDLGTLAWPAFDAAVRVLEHDPNPLRLANWWHGVEARILQRGFPWALELLKVLQGNDGAVGPHDPSLSKTTTPESCLRAAVRATYAVACLHTNPTADLAMVWEEVGQKAHLHPDPVGAARLRLRALAGCITASRWQATAPPVDKVAVLWEIVKLFVEAPKPNVIVTESDSFRDAELAAAAGRCHRSRRGARGRNSTSYDSSARHPLLARPSASIPPGEPAAAQWVHRSVADLRRALDDAQAHHGEPSPASQGPTGDTPAALTDRLALLLDHWWAEHQGPANHALAAFATTLAGRLAKLCREPADNVTNFFSVGLTMVRKWSDADAPIRVWADWLAPADLRARLQLEYLRGVCPSYQSPADAHQGGRRHQAAAKKTWTAIGCIRSSSSFDWRRARWDWTSCPRTLSSGRAG